VSVGALLLLGLTAVLPTAATRLRRDSWVTPSVQLSALAAAGFLATLAPPVGPVAAGFTHVIAVLAAAGGASPVVRAAFRVARRTRPPAAPVAELLRGGAVIGVLERVAVGAALVAGWPEGLAVALAVKGLARYPELREAKAGEQFIIGTFTSVLWAVGCWATAQALLR
jgi:F0F1-type ATP synthase membrane subunit c/vacuolar-type H+-ATPase subunit K